MTIANSIEASGGYKIAVGMSNDLPSTHRQLTQRSILITGVSSGSGAATARHFLTLGWSDGFSGS